MIDRELVEACYKAILGRAPESESIVEEKVKWSPSIEALIGELLGSSEFTDRLRSRVIDRKLVEACYKAILGRAPESESVVEEKIKWSPSITALIGELLGSSEFLNRLPVRARQFYLREGSHIDVDVSEAQMQALFARVQSQWRALGQSDPFWSVLSHDEFRAANLTEEALDAFYHSGESSAGLIDLFAARNNTPLPKGVCVDFGCGVGRVSMHLAERFDKVIAVDISEGNLRQCREMAARRGLSNIECRLLLSPRDLSHLPDVDFVYSVIALQHNTPPIQKLMLDTLLSKIKNGGGFFFQTQTFYHDDAFDVETYLNSPINEMDVHSLPMHEVLRLIENHGLSIREVAWDLWTGRHGSHTFFGVARPERASEKTRPSA
jgi:2-polyprenyl-3-methyl-5-hydroxy-6-metoxy-1,4-benzoquinol methylase